MPLYRYSAQDNNGRQLVGTFQATTPHEALRQLAQKGFRNPQILGEDTPQQQVILPPVVGAPSPPVVSVPILRPQPPAPVAGLTKLPSSPPPMRIKRTKRSTDKQRFFLFAQIGEQLRAGVNPTITFNTLATLSAAGPLRVSLADIAQATSTGGRISDVMETYPDLYPPHVVGLVRAGEEGGFLPDACFQISQQAEEAHKFKRFHWFVWVLAINAMLAIPLVWWATRAFLKYWDKLEATGGEGNPGAFMGSAFWEAFKWPFLPMVVVLYLVSFGLYKYFGTDKFRLVRHQLGLKWPVLGRRARHESVAMFSWTLGKVSEGGIAPNRAWQMAADSVPNDEMRRRLMGAGVRMNEGSRISDVIFGSKLFPEEYAPVVSTGEMTGTVTSSLQRLADASKTEYNSATGYAKMRTGCWGCLAAVVTSGIVLIIFSWFWYHELIGKVTSGMDTP